MENAKIGFFKKVKLAIFNFEAYENFINENIREAFKYFLKILLIFTIITTIAITYKVYKLGTEGLIDTVLENISEQEDLKITLEELNQDIEEMGGENVFIATFAVTAFIIIYIVFFVAIFFNIIIGSILSLIINAIINTKFKYVDLIKISVYAITLSFILLGIYQVVNILWGFTIKYFDYAYDAIFYIYLISVMMTMKTELIKNMQEVQKVVEIEKQVKKELKEEKEREQKQKDTKDKKEKKNEDEEEEPQGDNA